MSYDSWKTRSPEDDRTRGVRLNRFPQLESEWHTCPVHGWAEYRAYPGNVPRCVECEREGQR